MSRWVGEQVGEQVHSASQVSEQGLPTSISYSVAPSAHTSAGGPSLARPHAWGVEGSNEYTQQFQANRLLEHSGHFALLLSGVVLVPCIVPWSAGIGTGTALHCTLDTPVIPRALHPMHANLVGVVPRELLRRGVEKRAHGQPGRLVLDPPCETPVHLAGGGGGGVGVGGGWGGLGGQRRGGWESEARDWGGACALLLHERESAIVYRLSAIVYRQSAIGNQQSAIGYRQSAISNRLFAISYRLRAPAQP